MRCGWEGGGGAWEGGGGAREGGAGRVGQNQSCQTERQGRLLISWNPDASGTALPVTVIRGKEQVRLPGDFHNCLNLEEVLLWL